MSRCGTMRNGASECTRVSFVMYISLDRLNAINDYLKKNNKKK